MEKGFDEIALKMLAAGMMKDFYYVVADEENDFYWALNLDDHPNSFILDKSYQNFRNNISGQENESMVVIQPNV